ncbi:MAG: DUF4388 domain-containing protein [Acidobacteriota bacterium]
MALQGSLDTMALPEILQFVGLGQKTGQLVLSRPDCEKRIVFEDGFVVGCLSSRPAECSLRHLLFRSSLTPRHLEAYLADQQRTSRPLHEILSARAGASEDQLRQLMAHKVEDWLCEPFQWTEGDFDFVAGEAPGLAQPAPLRLDWQNLVMEGARRCDEANHCAGDFPAYDTRFELIADPAQGAPAHQGDRRLVELLQAGHAAGDCLPRFNSSDFAILTRIAQLEAQGALRRRDDDRPPPVDVDELELDVIVHAHAGRYWPALALIEEAPAEAQQRLGPRRNALLARIHDDLPPPRDCIPELLAGRAMSAQNLDARLAFIASRLNGTWNLEAIAQVCPFDAPVVNAAVHELRRLGLVALAPSNAIAAFR